MTVYTCDEYRAALAEGYYAKTTYDMTMQGFFIKASGVLDAMETARSAEVSHIADRPLAGATWLPPGVLYGMTHEDDEAIAKMVLSGKTIGDLIESDHAKVLVESQYCVRINYRMPDDEAYSAYVILSEMARADFSGDGAEDILVFRAIYPMQGSFRYYDMLIVERPDKDGPATCRPLKDKP